MEWTSVKEGLPENGKNVLATYVNGHGKRRTIVAFYVHRYQILSDEFFDDEWADCEGLRELNPADDEYYVREGWHENLENWDAYTSVPVSEGEVDRWMPIPEALGEVE